MVIRHLLVVQSLVFLFVFPAAALAQSSGDLLRHAEHLRRIGRYAEADETYQKLPQLFLEESAFGRACCQRAIGNDSAAEKILSDASLAEANSAAILALRATLAFERGDHVRANGFAKEALGKDSLNVAALWISAELHRVAGRLDEAKRGYEQLLAAHHRDKRRSSLDDRRIVGWASAQLARWNRNHDQFHELVNRFYPNLLNEAKNYWPAHLDAALLFAEKYNLADATAELDAALAINPHAAEVHTAKAALALQAFDLESAQSSLARALANNKNFLPAKQLEADLLLADIRPHEALTVLEAARPLNPVDEETLGRLAAVYGALDGITIPPAADSRMQKLIDEVQKRNPRCGTFFAALAGSLELLRKYPQSAAFYEEARQRMPQLIHVTGELGMLQMRLGDEVAGAKMLQEAFAQDPFNVRVKNMLEVLDVLQNYAVIETEHFVIRFDRGHDELLAKFAARYLEHEVFPEITQRLGYAPPGKSLFEIFSRAKNTSGHSWFSARMVGLPFIGTVGACAGKVVAIASSSDMPKKFDWARVLRHEFVHVVNLQQTNFNIPHWFTEALAVLHEDSERPADWKRLLARRLKANQVFDLATINRGFARPKSGDDWTLAYCQAALYADYLLATYGADATNKMLSAYADNATTAAALRRCFQVELADFETGYRTFLQRYVADVQPDPVVVEKTTEELELAAAQNLATADELARLAFATLQRGEKQRARRYADRCRQLDASNQLAAVVLARLQLSIGADEEALALIEGVFDATRPDEHAVWLLANLKASAGDTARAVELLKIGAEKFGKSDRWLRSLAKHYLETDETIPLRTTLMKLATMEPDNVTYGKKLAQLAVRAEDWPAAERWSQRVLRFEIADADAHAWLATALAQQNKHAAANDHFETAVGLEPNAAAVRITWAKSLLADKKPAAARQVLQDLLKTEPDHSAARKLLETIAP